jgi:hypothetical protein
MIPTRSRLLICALSIAATTIAAAAPPVIIDSEQKATAAVLTALGLKTMPANDIDRLSYIARGRAEEALRQLAVTVSPAGLMAARDGLVLPCGTSGNMTARMARALPRVLRLSWNACKFTDENGNSRERLGSADVVLLSDSFTPDRIGALRFGTATADFVDKRLIIDVDQITDEALSINLRMVGLIPMKRAFPLYGLFVGDFAFELTGFSDEHNHIELPDTGWPPFETKYRVTSQSVVASGATTYDAPKTHLVEVMRLHSGKVTKFEHQDGYPEASTQYSLAGLRLRRESDFADFDKAWSKESLDGRIELQYPAPSPYTCLSGGYTFKTAVPITRRIFGPDITEAGELLINGSTLVQFFTAANVPGGLPVPVHGNLIHMEVAGVGIFNYDTDGVTSLTEISQCPN